MTDHQTDDDLVTLDDPVDPDEIPQVERDYAGNGLDSQLERIKARRAERLADETVLLPIPTWQGDLVARYGVIESKELRKLMRRIEKSEGALGDNADLLVKACRGIQLRDENDDLQEIVGPDGGPVTFDATLAEKLGIDAGSQVEVVLHVIGRNPLAVGAHASTVIKWMQDTSKPVDGAIAGE